MSCHAWCFDVELDGYHCVIRCPKTEDPGDRYDDNDYADIADKYGWDNACPIVLFLLEHKLLDVWQCCKWNEGEFLSLTEDEVFEKLKSKLPDLAIVWYWDT